VIAYAGLAAVLKRDWGGLFEVGLGLAGGLTCALWGWRLVAGRERKAGGLLSPFALRAVASFLLVAPVFAALFTGWTLRNPMVAPSPPSRRLLRHSCRPLPPGREPRA